MVTHAHMDLWDAIGRQNFHCTKNQDGGRPLPGVVYISVTVGRRANQNSCESDRRGLYLKKTIYPQLCQTTSGLMELEVVISAAVARKATGISSRESARQGLGLYLMKTTSSLFCGGDATFCQITANTYGNAAVLLNMPVNNIVPVDNNDSSGRLFVQILVRRHDVICRHRSSSHSHTP